MPVIRISDATFANLGVINTWAGAKTPGETIDRLVREEMERLGIERDDEPRDSEAQSSAGATAHENMPGLTFTKLLKAEIDGRPMPRPNWSALLLAMIGVVKARGLDGDRLVSELAIPAKTERYADEGFKYHPELGLSVQGQSAADCWKEVDRLARQWRIPVRVEFRWRANPKAQHPGKVGKLRSGGA